jgi:hypothetical protein
MGLGQWKHKQNYPLNLTPTHQLKIYGITHHNNPLGTQKDIWKQIIQNIENKLDFYKHSTTTIFARATIVNRYIIPKLIYVATSQTTPTQVVKKKKYTH